MIDIEKYLYKQVKSILSDWDDQSIYAISFCVESNEAKEYGGYSNVTDFVISYNTEADCEEADELSEGRWNYAFWRQNEHPIIDTYEKNQGAQILFEWYKENGIKNIGYEDENCYDADFKYIGKGPVGHYELLTIVSNVARSLQEELFLKNKFGKSIPIIVHGLEYAWYDIQATRNANPNVEADLFFKAMSKLGMV